MRLDSRPLRLALLLAGVLALVVLVARNDAPALLASIERMGWRLGVVIVFPFVLGTVADTLAWRFAFRRDGVPFRVLYLARLAGEAFNLATPTASVGGEAVKAWLVRRWVGYDESLPSVIVAKTTIVIAQGLLLVLGFVCAWVTLPHESTIIAAMKWVLLAEVVAVGGFVLVQVSGVFGGGARVLGRLGLLGAADGSAALDRLDDALADFYRRARGRLALSVVLHFAGWLATALETWVVLRLLGIPAPLVTAAVIEAFSAGIRFATFVVPGSLGALEGGNMAIFAALGLGASTGLTFSLVRRAREATWVVLGFAAIAALRRPAVAAPAAAVPQPAPLPRPDLQA